MTIYEKIDTIFSGDDQNRPPWAQEILGELREIKQMLQEHKAHTRSSANNQTTISKDFYDFIKEFRKTMRADTVNKIYPTLVYQNKKLGVDFKGLLYDKATQKYISKQEAYEAYKYAYDLYKNGQKVV